MSELCVSTFEGSPPSAGDPEPIQAIPAGMVLIDSSSVRTILREPGLFNDLMMTGGTLHTATGTATYVGQGRATIRLHVADHTGLTSREIHVDALYAPHAHCNIVAVFDLARQGLAPNFRTMEINGPDFTTCLSQHNRVYVAPYLSCPGLGVPSTPCHVPSRGSC